MVILLYKKDYLPLQGIIFINVNILLSQESLAYDM